MSYHIIYDKQFIKVGENQFVPMILSGDNNVFDVSYGKRGKERRSRSWGVSTYFSNGKTIATKEDFEKSLTEYRDSLIERNKKTLEETPDWDVYSDKRFGYFSAIALYGKHTSGTSFGAFKNVYMYGIKNAKTVEELAEYHIRVRIFVWESLYDKELKEAKKEALPSEMPKTTEELVEVIKKFDEYYKGTKVRYSFDFCMGEYALKNMRHYLNVKTKKEKVEKEFPFFYVIYIDGVGYFVKNTKYGFKYIYYSDSWAVKKFVDEKKANKMAEKIRYRNISYRDKVEVKKIDKPITLKV